MKKIVLMLVGLFLFSSMAVAEIPQITYVKKARSHNKVQHHHAHKATKHHSPKRSHKTV